MRRLTDEERAVAKRKTLERQNNWRRKDRAANPEKYRKKEKRYCDLNREKVRTSINEGTAKLREEALEAYGGKCNCRGCHVNQTELLTFDHVEPVRGRTNGRLSTRSFYYWLRNNEYPPGIQILCGSCNFAKSSKPKCPLEGVEH